MLTIVIIAAAVVVAIGIGGFILARVANKPDGKAASQPEKTGVNAAQAEDLKTANTVLVNTRMTVSRLKDTEISRLGAAACDSIEKVLRTLKEKPEKIQTSRQLFNYYLPTLEKVISKYYRLESSGVNEQDIPEKLKGYLSDVTNAMGNLYESLFENDKLHVSVDMEAMTMAIKRDGLLEEEDFKAIQVPRP